LPTENSTPAVEGNDLVSQLDKLVELHSKGALSDEEFSAMKAKLISG